MKKFDSTLLNMKTENIIVYTILCYKYRVAIATILSSEVRLDLFYIRNL